MSKKDEYEKERIFTHSEVVDLLNKYMNKTLGQADTNNIVFNESTKANRGVAGAVVEQSIFKLKKDSDNRPDILVDKIPTEIKTTGIKIAKRGNFKDNFIAKERITIDHISPNNIVKESFYDSLFWNKTEHLLFIYYCYNSDKVVDIKDYANFTFEGYEFHQFSYDDICILKNDWETVRNYIEKIQEKFDNPESQYPSISGKLRPSLMYLEIAPRIQKGQGRFALKKTYANEIIYEYFKNRKDLKNKNDEYIKLPDKYFTFNDIDKKLDELTKFYKGKTVLELIKALNINVKNIEKLNKSISEQIVIKMFGANSNKINKIELFNKIGLIAKTICLTYTGKRTEDVKLFDIDFNEVSDEKIDFYDSNFYSYFTNNFLFVIFKEKDSKHKFKDNVFLGFKRISFRDNFIDKYVKETWEEIRRLILNKQLLENDIFCKGELKINKNGVKSVSINFPKASNYVVFVRGSGQNSSFKHFEINGISMYKQYIWVKGKYIVAILKKYKFI